MRHLIPLATFCLGFLGGYLAVCERVHRIRLQRNVALQRMRRAKAKTRSISPDDLAFEHGLLRLEGDAS